MARQQNGCSLGGPNYAIFVWGCLGVLLLYAPHVAKADVCDDLWEALEKSDLETKCISVESGAVLTYSGLPQDQPTDQLYNLTAKTGVTIISFTAGDPGDEDFGEYFSITNQADAISVNITGSLEDFGDYNEDGTKKTPTATSSKYTLKYQKNSEAQKDVSIDKFQFFITDVNNKPPEFKIDTYSVSLREDWPVDYPIPDLKENVRDRDQLDEVVHLTFDDGCPLNIDGSPDVSIKKADYSEISFKLKTKLDHEANSTVTCILTGTDDGGNEGSTTIVITVEAGQDKPPAFDHVFYKIDMTGNEELDIPLPVEPEAIRAVDQDVPPTEVKYTMENAEDDTDGKLYFDIFQGNDGKADIKLIQDLGEDFLNKYDQLRFVIYATDAVGDQDKAFLEINLPEPTPETTTTKSTTPGAETTEPETTVSETTTTTSGPSTTEFTCPTCPDCTTLSYSTDNPTCPTATECPTEVTCPICPTECPTDATCPICPTECPTVTPCSSECPTYPSTPDFPTCPTTTECPPCPTTQEYTATTTIATTTHTPSGPVFRKDTYVFQTLNNMDSVGTVKATIDGVESEEVEYSLVGDSGVFTINPNTGEISKPSDTEATSAELTVKADANSISTKTQVKIEVIEDLDTSLSIQRSLQEVFVKEEMEGETIGEVSILGEANAFCVIYQEDVDNYKDISFTFTDSTLKLKEGNKLDRENVQQVRVWVQIFNDIDTDCSEQYKEQGSALLRSQSLFVIEVEDVNDHAPTFDYPKSNSITLAYPEDPALQKVVGPVIQLRASDLDESDSVSYTLEDDDNFAVDQESGAVFWEGEALGTSCGGDNGCSFSVKAQDDNQNASAPVKCTVVSLPEDAIYTLTFPNMALSEVDEKLEKLSVDIGMTVRALYVTPKPGSTSTTRGASYNRYFNPQNYIRDDVHGTPFNLEVHVSVLDENGKIVSLDDFNNALSEDPGEDINAIAFKDKSVFHPAEDPDVFGYQIALGVIGGLLGILLLAFVIMAIIRYRKRSERRRGPEVPNPRQSYGNKGYVNDDIKHHDTLDGNSIKMNGTVNGFHEPPRDGRDSPPLNQSPLAVPSDTIPRGLRRTAPEHVPNLGQPASREPPVQFKEQKKPLQTPVAAAAPVVAQTTSAPTTAAAGVGARSADADQTPAEKMQQSTVTEPTPFTQAAVGSSSYNTSSYQPRQKKEPPPLTAAPKKSALKGIGGTSSDSQKTKEPQMPLSTMAPAEPVADYDSSPGKMATSSFSNLKASPPPKKKEVVQTKPDEDASKEGDDKQPERKKSNMKARTESDSNDQDKKNDQDKRKNSVAFKVLVEQKTIEAQNEGPSAKKQAENEAKAETNQAAVDIMEANKKKLEDDNNKDDADDNSRL